MEPKFNVVFWHFREYNDHANAITELDVACVAKNVKQIKSPALPTSGVDEMTLVAIGFMMIEVVKKINKSLSGMMMNTYFFGVLISTITLYSSSTVIFNSDFLLMSSACLCVSILTIVRLIGVTDGGQKLAANMKKCAYHLDRFEIQRTETCSNEMQLLRQELRYYCESPITPCSVFTLSLGTLVGTFGTILTYLIVLLQFKASEPSSSKTEFNSTTNIWTISKSFQSHFELNILERIHLMKVSKPVFTSFILLFKLLLVTFK